MNDRDVLLEEAASWLKFAEADRGAAAACLSLLPGIAAHHSQQPAENTLKDILVSAAKGFHKTHDLVELGDAMLPNLPQLADLILSVAHQAYWGIAYRDQGEAPEPEPVELADALNVVDRLASALCATFSQSAGTEGA